MPDQSGYEVNENLATNPSLKSMYWSSPFKRLGGPILMSASHSHFITPVNFEYEKLISRG